jgi:hypothetical protein
MSAYSNPVQQMELFGTSGRCWTVLEITSTHSTRYGALEQGPHESCITSSVNEFCKLGDIIL